MLIATILLAQLIGGSWETRFSESHWSSAFPYGFGYDIAPAGDPNRDGFGDFVVGQPTSQDGVDRLGSVRIFSGRDGSQLFSIVSPNPYSWFGMKVRGGADADGDGAPDLLISAPGFDSQILGYYGLFYVYSGRTGRLLHLIPGNSSVNQMPGIAFLEDLDGDGGCEFAVARTRDSRDPYEPSHGAVSIHSGRTGAVLMQIRGEKGDYLAGELAWLPDADGDGCGELLAGCPNAPPPPGTAEYGCVKLFSLSTGTLLREHRWAVNLGVIGKNIAAVDDLNRNGVADYAFTSASQRVLFFDGMTGNQIHESASPRSIGDYGAGIAMTADLDLDGVRDLAIGEPRQGDISLVSGVSGARLGALIGSSLGFRVVDLGDLDGDGLPELGSTGGAIGISTHPYEAKVFSYFPGISLSTRTLSAAAGGRISARIRFPGQHAGKPYGVLFSASGSGPVLRCAVAIPLTPDPLFAATVRGVYPIAAHGGRGVLDARGETLALFRAAPGALTGVVGRTLWASAVVVNPANGCPQAVSVAERITIES